MKKVNGIFTFVRLFVKRRGLWRVKDISHSDDSSEELGNIENRSDKTLVKISVPDNSICHAKRTSRNEQTNTEKKEKKNHRAHCRYSRVVLFLELV